MHEAHTPPRFRRAKLCLDVPLVPLLLVEPRLANRCNVLYVPTALNQDGAVREASITRPRGNILFGNFWQMASGGRGTSLAEQMFGLTSLWERRSAIVVYGMFKRTLSLQARALTRGVGTVMFEELSKFFGLPCHYRERDKTRRCSMQERLSLFIICMPRLPAMPH